MIEFFLTFLLVLRAISDDLLISGALLVSVGFVVAAVSIATASSFFACFAVSADLVASVVFGGPLLQGSEFVTSATSAGAEGAELTGTSEVGGVLATIEGGVTGPIILVSLVETVVGVVFSGCGWERMKEVGFPRRMGRSPGRDSLSMTGGMADVRFCRSCSMTSATFSELASLVTGITETSPGGVAGLTFRPFPCSGFT